MKTKTLALWAACALAAAGSACAPPAQKQPSPMTSLTPPVIQAPSPANNPGSLYSQAAQPNYLYEDNRARRIGGNDLLRDIRHPGGLRNRCTLAVGTGGHYAAHG